MPSDAEYISDLVERGRAFTYRTARGRDRFDLAWERSKDSWTEWLAEAEGTVKRLTPAGSRALDLIRQARHLEITGELSEEFYESRELAISALLMCAAQLSRGAVAMIEDTVSPTPRGHSRLWRRYALEILVGVAATVIGGFLLAHCPG